MHLYRLVPVLCLSGAFLFAQNQADPAKSSASLSNSDRNFMNEAAKGGRLEIDLGRLATINAANPAVKSFGKRMIEDHTEIGDKLASLASKKVVVLPPMSASPRQQQRLSNLKGPDFDRAYVNLMVEDHQKDVAAFKAEVNSASDPDLKKFVKDSLPILEEHLRLAESLQRSLGLSTTPTTSSTQ